MYIAPGQGQTPPWLQNFDVNRNSLSLCPFVASLKKNLFEVWFFYHFFFFFSHVFSPMQGQTTHDWGQKFYDNRKAFSLCPYVASFKMISSKSDFIPIFNDFINVHVYSPVPGGFAQKPVPPVTNRLGQFAQNFERDCSHKFTGTIRTKLKLPGQFTIFKAFNKKKNVVQFVSIWMNSFICYCSILLILWGKTVHVYQLTG